MQSQLLLKKKIYQSDFKKTRIFDLVPIHAFLATELDSISTQLILPCQCEGVGWRNTGSQTVYIS